MDNRKRLRKRLISIGSLFTAAGIGLLAVGDASTTFGIVSLAIGICLYVASIFYRT